MSVLDAVLLTEEERLAEFERLFGQYQNKGKIFEPTVDFYNGLNNVEGLLAGAKALYRWLGIKPYQLHVEFVGSNSTSNSGHITIPDAYQSQPYEVGALLAQAVIKHILEHRKQYDTDELFMGFATIQCGFGLLVLNGLERKPYKLLRMLGYNKGAGAPLQLTAFSTHDYANGVIEYASLYKTDLVQHIAYMTRSTQSLLSKALTLRTRHIATPKAVHSDNQNRLLWKVHALLLTLLVLIPVSTALYVWMQRPDQPSTAMVAQYQKLSSLEIAYNSCATEAQRQQNTYDQNDIFMQRQIDATLVRCASLRNQYNYEVDQYNKLVED